MKKDTVPWKWEQEEIYFLDCQSKLWLLSFALRGPQQMQLFTVLFHVYQ